LLSVGRNRERESEAFTLGVGRNDKRYAYKQIHLAFEIDFLTDLIDQYKPNYIINFAALAYATSWHKACRYYDTNITAVSKLCEHLYNKKFLKQFLQIGSSEVYGGTSKPAKETDMPNPTSPYAISKLAADYHILSCYNHNGFPGNVIRPSNCYGSGQYVYRIIPKAILYALNDKKFPLEGGGKAKKSFMHSYDLAMAIIAILKSNKFGKIYNAGVDEPVSMKNIIKTVAKITNVDFDNFVQITPGRKTEDSQYWINSSLIKKELNWKPVISLDQGVGEVFNWVKKYKSILDDEPDKFTLRA
jgi:dTDP-glucose 4,6-dehydratase